MNDLGDDTSGPVAVFERYVNEFGHRDLGVQRAAVVRSGVGDQHLEQLGQCRHADHTRQSRRVCFGCAKQQQQRSQHHDFWKW